MVQSLPTWDSRLNRYLVVAQSGVERGLQVGGFAARTDDERNRHAVLTGRERLGHRSRDHDRTRFDITARDARLVSTNIDDRRRSRDHRTGAKHGSRSDAHALNDDATRTDERPIFNDDGRSLRRLEHAADTH